MEIVTKYTVVTVGIGILFIQPLYLLFISPLHGVGGGCSVWAVSPLGGAAASDVVRGCRLEQHIYRYLLKSADCSNFRYRLATSDGPGGPGRNTHGKQKSHLGSVFIYHCVHLTSA